MTNYIIRRLLLLIPTLILVTIIVFLLSRLIPGNVIDLMMEQRGFSGVTGQIDRAKLQHELGLDVPIYTQYARWVGEIFKGNFGESLWSHRSVVDELKARLPISIELGLIAIIVGQAIAIPIGIYSAIRQDNIGDYVGRSIAILFVCIPAFWLGTMIMVFPAVWFGWSPPMEYIPIWQDPLKNLSILIIPGVIIGLTTSGTSMRMTRTMMLEVLRQDYIRTAWSKGLAERAVVFRHAVKNALIPVITIIGMEIPVLISGTVIIEQIFNLPGLGRLLIEALNFRDYTMLSGVNLFIAAFVIINNLGVDLSYAFFDPRIRYH
jgi:peptide/nickel transport system permease protein